MKQSILSWVDRNSGDPEEEKGVWATDRGDRDLGFSRRRKGLTFFSTSFSLSHVRYYFL